MRSFVFLFLAFVLIGGDGCVAPRTVSDSAESLAAATDPAALTAFIETPGAAEALLSRLTGTRADDPIDLARLSALSQRVLCTTCPKAPRNRWRWSAALVAACETTREAKAAELFVRELAVCGHREEAEAVRRTGEKFPSLASTCNQIAAQLKSREE